MARSKRVVEFILTDSQQRSVSKQVLIPVTGMNDLPVGEDKTVNLDAILGIKLALEAGMFIAPDPDWIIADNRHEAWTHIRFLDSPGLGHLYRADGTQVAANTAIPRAELSTLYFKTPVTGLQKLLDGNVVNSFVLRWQVRDEQAGHTTLPNDGYSAEATLTVNLQRTTAPDLTVRNFGSAKTDPVAFLRDAFFDPGDPGAILPEITHARFFVNSPAKVSRSAQESSGFGLTYRDVDLAAGAPQGVPGPVTVWVSVDGGLTWSRLIRATNGDLDSYLQSFISTLGTQARSIWTG